MKVSKINHITIVIASNAQQHKLARIIQHYVAKKNTGCIDLVQLQTGGGRLKDTISNNVVGIYSKSVAIRKGEGVRKGTKMISHLCIAPYTKYWNFAFLILWSDLRFVTVYETNPTQGWCWNGFPN